MGIDTTDPAKEMFSNVLIPLVGTQKVFTLNQRKGGLVDGLHDNGFLFAQGAVASVNTVVNCIGFDLKTDFRAMAGAGIDVQMLYTLLAFSNRNIFFVFGSKSNLSISLSA